MALTIQFSEPCQENHRSRMTWQLPWLEEHMYGLATMFTSKRMILIKSVCEVEALDFMFWFMI
jgi:hypothetical protein